MDSEVEGRFINTGPTSAKFSIPWNILHELLRTMSPHNGSSFLSLLLCHVLEDGQRDAISQEQLRSKPLRLEGHGGFCSFSYMRAQQNVHGHSQHGGVAG